MTSVGRRQILSHLVVAAAGVVVGSLASRAEAGRPHIAPGPGARHPRASVSISVERPDGSSLQDFWMNDSRYVAGELGARYQLRLTNHSANRVEAVVTVDGRDVVSGEVGNYAKQRGYVLDPWGSVVIDGFRQSMSQVASFRFAAISNSYSARRGTPQHVGVIGVAVFDEKPRPTPRVQRQPITPAPDPYPYWYGDLDAPAYDEAAPRGGATSSSTGRAHKSKRADRPSASPAPSAPRRESGAEDASEGYGGAAGNSSSGRSAGGDYRSPPTERYRRPESEQLGTQYGESRYSRVREVTFKRRNSTKPDALITLYYDSYDGLRARGVQVDPPEPVYPYVPEPQPFPERRFAPPPPRRY